MPILTIFSAAAIELDPIAKAPIRAVVDRWKIRERRYSMSSTSWLQVLYANVVPKPEQRRARKISRLRVANQPLLSGPGLRRPETSRRSEGASSGRKSMGRHSAIAIIPSRAIFCAA
jgi:hypothetical protein